MDQRELIGEQQEALLAIAEAALLNTRTAPPGIVQSYDSTTGLCVGGFDVSFIARRS